MEYEFSPAIDVKNLNDILMGTAILLGNCGLSQDPKNASATYSWGKYEIEVRPIQKKPEESLVSKIEITSTPKDERVEKMLVIRLEGAYNELAKNSSS
jgi:hypothetical protein